MKCTKCFSEMLAVANGFYYCLECGNKQEGDNFGIRETDRK